MLGKFSTIISSKIFSYPFFFPFYSGTPIIQILVHLMLSQSIWDCPQFFSKFPPLFCSLAVISIILSSSSLIHSFASAILLLIPSSVFFFFISIFVLFICLFFSPSRSLVNISYIFLICYSILFLRFWIIFIIIILNSLSGRLCISFPFI